MDLDETDRGVFWEHTVLRADDTECWSDRMTKPEVWRKAKLRRRVCKDTIPLTAEE